jgi:hypothetical protein
MFPSVQWGPKCGSKGKAKTFPPSKLGVLKAAATCCNQKISRETAPTARRAQRGGAADALGERISEDVLDLLTHGSTEGKETFRVFI